MLLGTCSAFAQTKTSSGSLRFTADCADEEGIVDAEALKTCKGFVLKGTGKEDYELVTFQLSMEIAGALRVMQFTTKTFSDATVFINAANKGKTIYIEKVKVKNIVTKKLESLPSSKIVIK